MKCYWGVGLTQQKNITLAWVKRFPRKVSGKLRIACSSFAQIFADGELIGCAPMRAAHGYARITEFDVPACQTLLLLVAGYGCNSYWLLDAPPFCAAEAEFDGTSYDLTQFTCYHVNDRVQKVPKFSYQRAYLESYRLDGRRAALLAGNPFGYEAIRCEEVPEPRFLPTRTHNPKCNFHLACKLSEGGRVFVNEKLPVWREHIHTDVGGILKGFRIDEWEDASIDEACRFAYGKSGEGQYQLYDLRRAMTGFARFRLHVNKETRFYVLFDEILLKKEAGSEMQKLLFYRNATGNVFKWQLVPGEYVLTTFEPYSMRYLKTVWFGDMDISEVGLIDYENPDAESFVCEVADRNMQAVLVAARHTFAQNAVDLLTDCPSRERAGWLSDSWFSSVAERLFTGQNLVEDAFLENYALAKKSGLPVGMLPMCYPADSYDGTYISNWAMWYVLEIYKKVKASGDRANADAAKANIDGIVEYFGAKENEYELLENLESWVFVEWSEANSPDHIQGVNLPSNMCWAKCLECIAELYDRPELQRKARRMRETICKIGFDGEFFSDNCIRGQDGTLVATGLKTEVCQYYAFWFDVVSRESHPNLYRELKTKFGVKRAPEYRKEIARPNAMYGIYMRLDILKREGELEQLAEECVLYFSEMAARTGTLWEHDQPHASCIHGFASYAATWLVYALTGWNGTSFEACYLGIDCRFQLPQKNGFIIVEVADGKRRIQSES